MVNEKVFVYGTLKSGGYNNHVMGGSLSLGRASTVEDNFTMYDGGYPTVVPSGKFHVNGELFEVTSEQVLAGLDRLEGVPHLFKRHAVEVMVDSGETVSAFMYVASPSTAKYLVGRRTVAPNDSNACEWNSNG